nr:MAG TPA: hypothetical protein [Caudoviricetes sp.]
METYTYFYSRLVWFSKNTCYEQPYCANLTNKVRGGCNQANGLRVET